MEVRSLSLAHMLMLKLLKKFNTNLNLLQSLGKKFQKLIKFLKAKKLLTAFIVIVIVILGFTAYNKFVPKPPEKVYELTTVKKTDITQVITTSGKILSETQVKLKFQTSGQLVWVGVKQGDYVKKWQAIASLDVRKLQKNLENELRDYSKERNDLEEAIQVTYKNRALTETIKRILEKNQWDLEKAVLDVEIEDIALKYATITSPIDGIITNIDVPVAGVNITPTTAYFTVADPNNLIFEAEIDEVDIGLINSGQTAELILDAFTDDPIPLTVDSIDFSASADSSGSTVFIAKFKLNNNYSSLMYRLGMNGEIFITISEKQAVLTIPIEALIEDEDKKVKVVIDGKVIEKTVTTGIFSDDDIEITSGLSEGDTIVVSKISKKK